MGSLSARGRVLVVLAFVTSAALCAGAAVAFVMATNDSNDKKTTTIPTIHPTLVFPTDQATPTPSATPTPTASPTPTVTVAPSPTPAATTAPSTTSSPAPRRTTTPKPSPTGTTSQGLRTSATLNSSSGTTTDEFVIQVHATDPSHPIYLKSVRWDNGAGTTLNERGTACNPPATAPADCRNYTISHMYDQPGTYIVEVTIVSGKDTSILHFTVTVDPAPSPS